MFQYAGCCTQTGFYSILNPFFFIFFLILFCFCFWVRFIIEPRHSYSDESPLIPNEFLFEPHITAQDLGGEPILGLMLENEPDLWIQAVPSNVKRSLKEKQVNFLSQLIFYWFKFILYQNENLMLCGKYFNENVCVCVCVCVFFLFTPISR